MKRVGRPKKDEVLVQMCLKIPQAARDYVKRQSKKKNLCQNNFVVQCLELGGWQVKPGIVLKFTPVSK
ncbi:MAG: hypothetical protein WCS42_22700 [Verrucomicrobiota bacterium]